MRRICGQVADVLAHELTDDRSGVIQPDYRDSVIRVFSGFSAKSRNRSGRRRITEPSPQRISEPDMPTLEDVFDTSLVDLWYDEQETFDREMQRASVNLKRFENLRAAADNDWLAHDVDLLKRVHADIEGAIKSVERGQQLDSQRLDDMLFVFSIANHVVSCDNDILDAMFASGLASVLVLLPWVVLQRRAKLLQQRLRNLERALQTAKRQQLESGAQLAINGAITVISLLTGPVGLLVGGSVMVAQILIDDTLGPDTSSAATWGSRANSAVSPVSDAVQALEKAGTTSKSVAKRAGKAAPGVGVLFDLNEIRVAVNNVSEIERLIRAAESALQELQKDIRLNRPKLNMFFTGLARLQRSLETTRAWASDARGDLWRAMDKTGYTPG